MVEKQKELQQSAKRASDSSVSITGEEDAASVRSAGSNGERLSAVMSFKTAVGSVLSRTERRQQREQLCQEGKGPKRVFLSKDGHAKRQQSEKEVDRLHCLLLTQNVDVISGGLICLTKLREVWKCFPRREKELKVQSFG